MKRATIARSIDLEGIGLHRGSPVTLTLEPSEGGLAFSCAGVDMPVSPLAIVDTRLNTTIGAGGVRISTIEHLMSALYGLGITDCRMVVGGDEMPVMDGSALQFVERILEAGLTGLPGEATPLVVREPLRVEDGDAWVEVVPGHFSVSYAIDFDEAAIGSQRVVYDGADYVRDIAPARTFGRLKDVEMMRSMGLSLGGSLDNAVVVDGAKVLNPGGLRFADEFVRHKVLDLLGDLWTLGRPIEAEVRANRANHRLHIELARRLWEAYPVA